MCVHWQSNGSVHVGDPAAAARVHPAATTDNMHIPGPEGWLRPHQRERMTCGRRTHAVGKSGALQLRCPL